MTEENHIPSVNPFYQRVLQGSRAYAGKMRAGSRNAVVTLLITIIRSSLFGVIRLLFACGSLAMGLGLQSALPRGEIWQDLVCGPLSGALNPLPGLLVFFRCTGQPLPLREGCKSASHAISSAFSDTQDKGVDRQVLK